eukprot:gnl/MRDRNA2_/MRDRNA2_96106_c0_seq1.p1 gnl/MRDRNA2_/MRDRNA2_96106_c0~~gnl/MRDRNA2_/MRDRNA2_96106_c0_seq1.p1  ORF type:complete len:391 (+),score=85.44 gnl/MRDRNA2_/MRDRNA2_96106_c0_seq1:111-1283(+)
MNASAIDRLLLDAQKNRIEDGSGLKTYEPLFAKLKADVHRAEQRHHRAPLAPSPSERFAVELTPHPPPPSVNHHRSATESIAKPPPHSSRHQKPAGQPTVQALSQSARHHRSEPAAAPSADPSVELQPPENPAAPRRKQVEKKAPQPPPPPPKSHELASGCYSQPKIGAAFVRRAPYKRHAEASDRRIELSPLGSEALCHSDTAAVGYDIVPPRQADQRCTQVAPPVRQKDGRSAPGRFRNGMGTQSSPKAAEEEVEAELHPETDEVDGTIGISREAVESKLALCLSLGVIDGALEEYGDQQWDVEAVEDIIWRDSSASTTSPKVHNVSAPHSLGELKNTPRRAAPGPTAVTPSAPSSTKDSELKRRKEEKKKMMSRLAAIDRRPGPQPL